MSSTPRSCATGSGGWATTAWSCATSRSRPSICCTGWPARSTRPTSSWITRRRPRRSPGSCGEGAGALRAGGRSAPRPRSSSRATTWTACSVPHASTVTTATASSPHHGDRPPPRQALRGARLRPQQGAAAAGWRIRRGLPGRDHAATAGRRSAERRHPRRLAGKPDFTVNGGIDSPHLELRGRRRGAGDAARPYAHEPSSPAWAICVTSSMRRVA